LIQRKINSMKDYIKITTKKDFGSISVTLNIKDEKVAAIGQKMKAIDEQADMTGYNWEALLSYYLDEHHPEVSAGMGADANAGKYTAYYKLIPQNEKKAEQLASIFEDLIENESTLYDIVKNNADDIDWE
jgi:hypothetical protein